MKAWLLRLTVAAAAAGLVAVCLARYQHPSVWLPMLTAMSLCR